MEYKVGQILYLCNEEKMKIIPLQVIEEIIRTTINGTEKSYILMFPDSKKTKVNISSFKSGLFEDIDAVKNHMIQNATSAITKMALTAEELKKDAFGISEEKDISKKQNNVQVDNNSNIITVDLGDGTKAKINSSNLEKVVSQ